MESEKTNSNFVLFKREVFHTALGFVFESIKSATKFGEYLFCGDQVPRTAVVRIPIATMDLEEQYVIQD